MNPLKSSWGTGWRSGPDRVSRQVLGPAVQNRRDYTARHSNCNAAEKGPQDRPKPPLFNTLRCESHGAKAPGDESRNIMDAKTPAAKRPAEAEDLADTLRRIAEALERLSPRASAALDLAGAEAFVWHPDGRRLAPVPKV